MISIEQINGEIAALEEQVPTHAIMQKLAALYVVRDHMGVGANVGPVCEVVETLPAIPGGSEFSRAVSGRPAGQILPIIDELMQTLQAINPRLYNGVMQYFT